MNSAALYSSWRKSAGSCKLPTGGEAASNPPVRSRSVATEDLLPSRNLLCCANALNNFDLDFGGTNPGLDIENEGVEVYFPLRMGVTELRISELSVFRGEVNKLFRIPDRS